MPEEIFDCKWIDIVSTRLILINLFSFCQGDLDVTKQTRVAQNAAKILLDTEKVKRGEVDLNDMPLGDMFRDNTFSFLEYELPQNGKNIFYSSEGLKRLNKHITGSGL